MSDHEEVVKQGGEPPEPLPGSVVWLRSRTWRHVMILAAILPIGLVFECPFLISAFGRPGRVVFTDQEIILPRPHWSGLLRAEIRVAFSDIARTRINSFGIGAYYSQGAFSLPRVMFSSRQDFDRAAEMLVAGVASSRKVR